jgi:hypothetical protein
MQVLLTKEEYDELANAKQKALELAREQCQKEFEKAKDAFLQDLCGSADIQIAFAGIGGAASYGRWRDRTRTLVKNLNMPK